MKHQLKKWMGCLIAGLFLLGGVCEHSIARELEKKPAVILLPMPQSAEPENKSEIKDSGEKEEIRNEEAMPDQSTVDGDPVLDKSAEINSDIQAGTDQGYEPKSQLDPFKPLIQEKAPGPSEVLEPDKPQRILTPLEKMSLSQIRLVAVVIGENKKIAMVEEATGKGYEVRIGTYMGKNGGRVVDIQSDHIVVKELVADFKGIVTERFQELKLHKPDNGE
ncbi:pilus assembly protein PilP [Desulfotignum phosphitoxidans]|uniref:Type 4 fimbrial assembly protein PilP n=1 Tax=Desulfotignum phosphitoxidans DSM 13687 TaxID=1286635 RepID=S0FUJ5_9BACT|nr:pilus assembly protein PilP [Desulfotignum phosphitoxidans]EMS78380.1 type 4 fimbrial assembly protein PilP [Desulfotignum phosphitoxidans DSM 13687]